MSSIRMTEKKLAANRANAQKSTGPRTASGKAISRMNRLRHGLYAEDVIVPQLDESKEIYEDFRQNYLEELKPKSLIQYTLAEQYIYDQWRLRRYRRMETGFTTQAWARNHTLLPTLKETPIVDSDHYVNYDTKTRLGKSRTLAEGVGALTFDHDYFTILQRNEQRLRKSAAETLKQFHAAAPPEDLDEEGTELPPLDPAPVALRYGPRSLFELAKKLGKPLPPDLVPDPNEPPDRGPQTGNPSAEGVNR